MPQKFVTSEALKFGWGKTKKHFWFLLAVMAGIAVISAILGSLGGARQGQTTGLGFIAVIISWAVNVCIEIGFIKILLKILDDVRGTWKDFIPSARLFWHMLLGNIIYGLIVFLGMLLAIIGMLAFMFWGIFGAASVSNAGGNGSIYTTLWFIPIMIIALAILAIPGIILGIKYRFYSYLIVDKNMSAWDAIKESGRITRGEKWNIFVFGLASFLAVLIGAIALLVGLLWAIPTAAIAAAYIYRKLAAVEQTAAGQGVASRV